MGAHTKFFRGGQDQGVWGYGTVSYTHLDVYKRQPYDHRRYVSGIYRNASLPAASNPMVHSNFVWVLLTWSRNDWIPRRGSKQQRCRPHSETNTLAWGVQMSTQPPQNSPCKSFLSTVCFLMERPITLEIGSSHDLVRESHDVQWKRQENLLQGLL